VKQQPDGIFISQDKYIVDILKNFDFCSIKTATTLIASNKPLVKDEDGVDVVMHVYRSMIGFLMYLTASRPDIMFVVYACARFQVTPKASHLNAVKRIFRRLISWQCKKQTIMANSTIEAEYVAAANCSALVPGRQVSRLRATYGVELVSAASLVNTASPTLSTAQLELVLPGIKVGAASSQIVNDEKQIHATVDSKAVVVIKASTRSSLLFNDADGTACLTNKAIFQNLALIGYEGELNKLPFQKVVFSTQWKYLILLNEFSTNIALAVICLATNQKFNFSKLIFDGMLRNLDTSKMKFLMYPRFLMVFLNNQIELGEPFKNVYVTPAHTQKVFSNMSRKGVKFSRKVTLLFDCMLVPHQAPKGEGLDQPTEPQPTPSPTHPSIGEQPPVTALSPSHDATQDSRDSLEGTNRSEVDQVQSSYDIPLLGDHTSKKAEGGLNLEELFVLYTNLSNRVLALETSKDAQAADILKLMDQIKKLKRKCKPSISHHKAWLKSVKMLSMEKRLERKEYVSKQGRKNVKPEPTLDAFDDLDAGIRDNMETEDVVKEGRQSSETDKLNTGSGDKRGSTKELVSTAIPKTVSIARPELSTASLCYIDAARQEDSVVEPITPPTTTIDLQAEVKRERQREKEASKATIAETYDEVQIGIDGDALFIAKLQQEEREEYTIKEIAKFLKRVIDDFKPMDSDDAVKDSKEIAGVHKQKVLEEPNITKIKVKQEGHEESIKKRPEEEQLKAFLKIVPDEEGIIDYEVLEKRFPIIK
ncbi:hypothetical protein Tco_1063007, partial [Tanacetum coccineum]